MKETTLYLQNLMIYFTFFNTTRYDCSRKDLDKQIPVLGVQEQAHKSNQELTRAHKSSQEQSRAINLYFILLTNLNLFFFVLWQGNERK